MNNQPSTRVKSRDIGAIQKKITVMSVLFTFLTGILVAGVCLVSMHAILKQRQDERLNASLLINAGAIEQYLANARENGLQFTSRSAIRKKLEDYNAGLLDLKALQEFSIPKLEDALNAADNIPAIKRYDAKGRLIIAVARKNTANPGLDWNTCGENSLPSAVTGQAAQAVSDPFLMHEKTFFAVTTPIVNSRNERVGTDVILVDFSGVDRLFATRQTEAVSLVLFFKKTGIFYDLIKREFKATDAEEIPLPVRQRVASGAAMKNRHGYLKGATTSGEKMLWGDKELSSADWIIFCGFSEKRTYGPIYDNLLHISLLLFVIILIASFLAKRLLGPFSGSIIVETRELEREIASRIDAVKMLNEELHHEIAERTQTGEILEKSEHRLKEAEKIAHLGHWELDLKTNSLYWSEEVYRIFGLDEGKRNLTFENFMATIHPDDKDNVLELYNNSVELGAPYSVVHRIILPDGVIKYVHEQCVHETDETGKRVKSFGTVLDVTDAKRAEELRRSAEKKEMELRKTESLRQMAGAIAHNFNNLLTAIMGGIECAIPEATGKQHKWLDMAFQSTNRAAQLGKLLLMYLGQFHVRFVSLNLDQFWRDFRNSGVVAVPDNIAIRYEIAENLPPVEGNSELLTTLFKNVIENSIEAIDKNGGLITVSCQVKEYAAGGIKNEFADADAEDVAAGRYVLVCVDDNGCGIDGAVLRNLFDPFFSTRFTGRGLGLPVVQGIVKTHRGLIKIESEQGKGTVVKILFPNGAGFNS